MDEWKRKQDLPKGISENEPPEADTDPTPIPIPQAKLLPVHHIITGPRAEIKPEQDVERTDTQPPFLDLETIDSSYVFPDMIAPVQHEMTRKSTTDAGRPESGMPPEQASSGDDSDDAEMAAFFRNLKAKKKFRKAGLERQQTPKRPRVEDDAPYAQVMSPNAGLRTIHNGSPPNAGLVHANHAFYDNNNNRATPYNPGHGPMPTQLSAGGTPHYTRSMAKSTKRSEIPNPRAMSDRGQGHLAMRGTQKESGTWN